MQEILGLNESSENPEIVVRKVVDTAGEGSYNTEAIRREIDKLLKEVERLLEEITRILDKQTGDLEQPGEQSPSTGSTTSSSSSTSPGSSSSSSSSPASPGTSSSEGSGLYTVVPGDSLWKIAQRFLGAGSRYPELVEANKARYPSLAKNPNLIYPGWQLRIPGVHVPPTPGSSGPGTVAPPTVPPPSTGARGGRALLGWLQQAGLSGENLRMAWAIGMAESGGNPRAHNDNPRTGDNSYGLFQINMIGALGPDRRRRYGLSSNEDLFDPMTNIRVMLSMSNNCTNWQPWSVYKRGTYRRFYDMYPPR
jgi:LysM repeat protein